MNIYFDKIAEEMGKKAKDHRKKVQARNAKLQIGRKKFAQELNKIAQEQAKEQLAILQKNYEAINANLSESKKQEILEQTGVRFSD